MLPQQRLLLELLCMSGEIAVPTDVEDTILWRTLNECEEARFISLAGINDKMCRISVTRLGRMALK